MKIKYILIPLLLIILAVGTYYAYRFYQLPGRYHQYELTLQSELNPSDFHTPGGQAKEIAETYVAGSNWYHANILEYADESGATNGISKLKEQYNPGMIVLNKKYVNYKELSPGSHYYFYQSGQRIITMDISGDKNDAEDFIIWYYSKYPNK